MAWRLRTRAGNDSRGWVYMGLSSPQGQPQRCLLLWLLSLFPFSILLPFWGWRVTDILILCFVRFPQKEEDIVYQHNSLESIVLTTEPVKQRQGNNYLVQMATSSQPRGIRFLSPTLLRLLEIFTLSTRLPDQLQITLVTEK